ncbi:MAG: ZIP family metal transporter [Candidatus Magasanikbacteria bacterium]
MNKKIKQLLTPLSAGIFIGVAIFDGFPHAFEDLGYFAFIWITLGIFFWWTQKKVLHKMENPETPTLTATALWLHSLVEGLVTGLAFGISQTFGLVLAGGMILHLLPEFFAAFAILRGAGSKKSTSIWVPFVGYIVLFVSFFGTYIFLQEVGEIATILGAVSAGAFLYVGYRILKKEKYHNTKSLSVAIIGAIISGIFVLFV